eukprot:7214860-Alexandrium_andersonii.AAC.1
MRCCRTRRSPSHRPSEAMVRPVGLHACRPACLTLQIELVGSAGRSLPELCLNSSELWACRRLTCCRDALVGRAAITCKGSGVALCMLVKSIDVHELVTGGTPH